MKLTENIKCIIIGLVLAVVILVIIFFGKNLITGATVETDSVENSVLENDNYIKKEAYENKGNNEDQEYEKTDDGDKLTVFSEPVINELEVIELNEIIWSSEKDSNNLRRFEWDHAGKKWAITIELSPEIYSYYKEKGRLLNGERHTNYDIYVSDYFDDDLIKSLTNHLRKLGTENGLQYEDIPNFIASFVQSLDYNLDIISTGFDEYPRFPFETLYDNGGDCEDTSILVSALLKELGHKVIMVSPPGHMAVGVKCEESFGTYYDYGEESYCYLESNRKGYVIGQIPEDYENSEANPYPLDNRPILELKYNEGNINYDTVNSYTNVDVEIKNLGSEWAENVQIYVVLQTRDEGMVWSQFTSEEFDIKPDESYKYSFTNLHSTTGEDFRIYVRAYGSNVISNEIDSEWVTWENE